MGRNKKDIQLRTCLFCREIIPRNTKQGENRIRPAQYITAKYCSKSCKGKDNPRGEKHPLWKERNTCLFCKVKLSSNKKSIYCKKCYPIALSGKNHWNWQNGKTDEKQLIRISKEYKLWRVAVFERDNYMCIWCGDKKGGNLEADHIKPFAYFPELRLAIDNGRTLCKPCHKTTDTYGYLARKFKQKYDI